MGRLVDVDRFKYAVTDYHTELVQIIIALELAKLSISDYSRAFDDSYSLLKSNVADKFTIYFFYFGSPQSVFYKLFSCWFIL